MRVILVHLLITVVISVLLAACGGGGGGGSVPPTPTGGNSGSGDGPTGGATPSDSGNGGSDSVTVNPPDTLGVAAPLSENVGHPTFLSPHVKPIVANGHFIYAANTPADTVDVIDSMTRNVVLRINVGVDPVGLAVRPDGKEVWVANHISDSINVIDTDMDSPTLHHVIHTVQAVDTATLATDFDEPTGLAFATNSKVYAALGPDNAIAVIDAQSYTVTGRLPIRAQDPRAITGKDDRLYVVPFESNNRTQLSGCRPQNIDGDQCTFDAVEHVFTNNNVLSLNYDADIVRNPRLPDRDLFVFDTSDDSMVRTVDSIGTLLYGLAVDSAGRVFVTQADARNDANGRAGTEKHGLAQMQNRAFLNQITRVSCQAAGGCVTAPFDLEPLPPENPQAGMGLATPYGIQISTDDSTLVATAASSNMVMTLDAETGAVLGRVAVGAVPRGVALHSDSNGAPVTAWVLNVVDNSVSVVDVSSPDSLSVATTIFLDDPTPADMKAGRLVFNDANASTTGTFSCESCHPDGHTDQLIWVLETPMCDVAGCTQIPPRLTMPVRGLRDTAPYHWDGIPGDPFGGTNTASINTPITPNCAADNPRACARVLVDVSMATTMCEVSSCSMNDENKLGRVDAADRDALADFILNIPYPPAQRRGFENRLTSQAIDGFFEFSFTNDAAGRTTGAQTCGDCHKMPYLVSSNTPGTGMDAPTWRGAYDRWMILPQGRLNISDLLDIVNMDDSFPERDMWILAGASPNIWDMVLEGSTGFVGGFARQVTLNSVSSGNALNSRILDALEDAATDGSLRLQGEGVQVSNGQATGIGVSYVNGRYEARNTNQSFSREELENAASAGELLITLTARSGINTMMGNVPPALWPAAPIQTQTRNVELAFLSETGALRINGRHIQPGATLLLNGSAVEGNVRCETGTLPACDGEIVMIEFDEIPSQGGLHFLQVQNQQGFVSNDMMFFSEQAPHPTRRGNLITSGGSFAPGLDQFENNWNTVEIATNSITESFGEVRVDVRERAINPWHAQISHAVMVTAGNQYTLCYDARADGARIMTAYVDTNLDQYVNLGGGQFRDNLTTSTQNFSHTFTATQTDLRARVAFDFAQSSLNVHIDNIGLYEGLNCGTP